MLLVEDFLRDANFEFLVSCSDSTDTTAVIGTSVNILVREQSLTILLVLYSTQELSPNPDELYGMCFCLFAMHRWNETRFREVVGRKVGLETAKVIAKGFGTDDEYCRETQKLIDQYGDAFQEFLLLGAEPSGDISPKRQSFIGGFTVMLEIVRRLETLTTNR